MGHCFLSAEDGFQDPLQIPKSVGAQNMTRWIFYRYLNYHML
jgi:hypothetical protein